MRQGHSGHLSLLTHHLPASRRTHFSTPTMAVQGFRAEKRSIGAYPVSRHQHLCCDSEGERNGQCREHHADSRR